MTNPISPSAPIELRVTLERGDRRCTIAGPELDRLCAGPMSVKLTAVLVSRTGAPTSTAAGNVTNVNVPAKELSERNVPAGADSLQAEAVAAASALRLASYLADRLDDAKSLAFYRRVAVEVPREVIQEALMAALDLAPAEVRRSRGAYFAAIVRSHLRPRPRAGPPRNPPHAPPAAAS